MSALSEVGGQVGSQTGGHTGGREDRRTGGQDWKKEEDRLYLLAFLLANRLASGIKRPAVVIIVIRISLAIPDKAILIVMSLAATAGSRAFGFSRCRGRCAILAKGR